ncbi:MAG: molybdopterin converting factor subunit 1 [Betaproteobacteria bacterium]|nr:molybdopterin converting factor subunit 1 [Betaproteobacteria bacterium]
MIRILYFAYLREKIGFPEERFELSDIADLAGLLRALTARGEPWAQLAQVRNLRCAVNQEMAFPGTPLKDGDEVAFFPPVTGG